jgi:hypothetical protein
MGELEYLDPMSREYLDKLEHIRGAVAHHMYEEESDRFLDLKRLPPADQARLTERYAEEFDRYMGRAPNAAELASGASRPAPSQGPPIATERH